MLDVPSDSTDKEVQNRFNQEVAETLHKLEKKIEVLEKEVALLKAKP